MAESTPIGSVWVSVRPTTRGFGRDLERQTQRESERAGRRSGGLFGAAFARSGVGPIRASLGVVGKAASGIFAGVAVGSFLKDAITQASDLGETTSKVAQIFGKDALPGLEKFAAGAAKSLGQSKQAALDATAQFGTFGKAAGLQGPELAKFSTRLTSLASDMASFGNTSPEEAAEALGAALRGESEPIRKYGVLLDDATLRQEALGLGLIKTTKEALTPAQKVLAAQAAITKQTADAQGDFARTSGGLANQQRILSAQFANAKTSIGAIFLPLVTRAFTFLNAEGVPALRQIGEFLKAEVLPRLQDFATFLKSDVVPPLAGMVKWIIANKEALVPLVAGFVAFKAITAGMALATTISRFVQLTRAVGLLRAVQLQLNIAMLANPIGLVVAGIALLVAGVVLAYKRFDTFRRIVDTAWLVIRTATAYAWEKVVKPALSALWDAIKFGWEQFQKFGGVISNIWSSIKTAVRTGVRFVVDFFLGMAESILGAAEKAFGWVPGIGDKLKSAKAEFSNFRDSVNRSLGGIDNRTVSVRADLVAGKGINQGQGGTKGLTLFANGGVVENHSAQIAKAGAMRLWAEPETGGEAYIPLAQSKRPRSAQILGQVADRFGFRLERYANGGIRDRFDLVTDFSSKRQAQAIAAKMQAKIDAGALRAGDVIAKRVSAALAKLAVTSGGTTPGKNGFAFPLPRGSYRVGGGINSYPGHTGQDFPAPIGTKVFAPMAGNLLTIRLGNRSYGNYANITAGGLRSIQAHLSGFARGPGHVRAGELVGYVGSTGNSTGPHLHQEFRRNGRVVSPSNYLKYDRGGYLQPGMNLAYNGTGKPEPVLTTRQLASLEKAASSGGGYSGPLVQNTYNGPVGFDPEELSRRQELRARDAIAVRQLRRV